ncbi:23S rRNA pseudouridine(955/2504/2580) synthase RluC [Candidatus Methylospira mobilis]|uniref:Pseudouridine synthase n=1 Tax=Candidatus Methylospira mobilis TaxID=1808979 RepID=A0A5Q0BQ47_9GAMM|nr:23S rRNA pseudouridine(955/2504/2580) synthase RluC [Candidatus Methylospira mobilis]QFY44208.1 23S rRNA pseudouridine(955/2504/2580) synthase RluC [Candidatus Methylospira mobilis]WNV06363.1 23S rRNA pseudouridine(955/2504/2580) synthase RluC [Candidatus Methylospira mobilis]
MSEQPPAAGKASLIEIDESCSGQRIDNFLFTKLKGVPKSHVYRILRSGEVRVNGGRSQPSRKLDTGDKVRIPPLRLPEREEAPLPGNLLRARLEHRILFEDDSFMVVNKPAGMAVHGGSGLAYGVIEAMRNIRPELRFIELVHRLDRDTSGCLLLAKKRSALRDLHELFRSEHDVEKFYLALLSGVWARKQQLVDAPLKKNTLKSGERIVRIASDGKPAQTHFRRMRKYSGATLVEAQLLTGRTHQIRVHAQSIGHPLAGDERYGEDKLNAVFRNQGLKRLFLHAAKLSFKHPATGKAFNIEAPLETDLQQYLDTLATLE